jgi:tetratricopeptide (TPR) repeat protein
VTSNNPVARVRTTAIVAALLVLGAGAVSLQAYRDRHFRPAETEQLILYVRSPAVAKRLSLSFDALAADLYWIRAIQYYGGTRLSPNPNKHYELLYPLLDLTTSLDPQFSIAYRFGAFFLSEHAPGGAGRPDLAVALLQKAMHANPDRWQYPYEIGFVYYRDGQYREAADWFRRASEVPGATNWLKPLAAVTLAAGGHLEASRVLWQNLLTSDEDWLRRTAEQRLQQLDATEQVERLQALTAAYERRHGDPPTTWQALVAEGALRDVPRDPAGYPYVLNPWWGLVTLSTDSPLWPLPTERAP